MFHFTRMIHYISIMHCKFLIRPQPTIFCEKLQFLHTVKIIPGVYTEFIFTFLFQSSTRYFNPDLPIPSNRSNALTSHKFIADTLFTNALHGHQIHTECATRNHHHHHNLPLSLILRLHLIPIWACNVHICIYHTRCVSECTRWPAFGCLHTSNIEER